MPIETPAVPPSKKPSGFVPTGNDRATRLADVIIAWNVFQHFYPYFDAVTVDWPETLTITLSAAATDRDEKAFLQTLWRLVARAQDGHGYVSNVALMQRSMAPFVWDWVEGQLTIVAVADDCQALKPGDVVVNLDGKAASEMVADAELRTSASTPQHRRWLTLMHMAFAAPNAKRTFDVRGIDGTVRKVVVIGRCRRARKVKKPPVIASLRRAHVCRSRPVRARFTAAVSQLEGSRHHLRRAAIRMFADAARAPDRLGHHLCPMARAVIASRIVGTRRFNSRVEGPAAKPRFKAKSHSSPTVIAVSYGDHHDGQHYKLGASWAGRRRDQQQPIGRVARWLSIAWTGMKVLKHDGSRCHGVGAATVPAATIAGIAAGRRSARSHQVVSQY